MPDQRCPLIWAAVRTRPKRWAYDNNLHKSPFGRVTRALAKSFKTPPTTDPGPVNDGLQLGTSGRVHNAGNHPLAERLEVLRHGAHHRKTGMLGLGSLAGLADPSV